MGEAFAPYGSWPRRDSPGLAGRSFLRQNWSVKFDIVGPIENAETIATGSGVKSGRSFERSTVADDGVERKGIATVRLPNGTTPRVELHWYEAHGIGKRDFKIKSYLDEQ